MQPFMLPDYLDGSKKSKNMNLDSIAKVCSIVKYISIVNNKEFKIDLYDDPYIEGVRLRDLIPFISNDESLKVFLRTYKYYKENNGLNYIVEKNLAKALMETKLDVKVKYLPKNFNAFIDIKQLIDQDGDEIRGVFVNITQEPSPMLFLGIASYTKDLDGYAIAHLNIPLDNEEDSLEDLIRSFKEVNHKIPKDMYGKVLNGNKSVLEVLEKEVSNAGYYKHLHTILNTIIYATNAQKINLEEFNVFSEKKSKKETQKNIYTSKGFIILGKDFFLPKEYSCGEVEVSGHFRWQPYGPERSLLKHIYIKPHIRNYGIN